MGFKGCQLTPCGTPTKTRHIHKYGPPIHDAHVPLMAYGFVLTDDDLLEWADEWIKQAISEDPACKEITLLPHHRQPDTILHYILRHCNLVPRVTRATVLAQAPGDSLARTATMVCLGTNQSHTSLSKALDRERCQTLRLFLERDEAPDWYHMVTEKHLASL